MKGILEFTQENDSSMITQCWVCGIWTCLFDAPKGGISLQQEMKQQLKEPGVCAIVEDFPA